MVRFLFRNLKGYRLLVVIALTMAFAQVLAALFNAFPLKFILDKVVNGKDPHVSFLDPLISFFDNIAGHAAAGSSHSTAGIILFSATAIVMLGILIAIL